MQRPFGSSWVKWILAGVAGAIVFGSFVVPLGRAFLSQSSMRSDRTSSGVHGEVSPRIGFSIQRDGQVLPGTSESVVFPRDRMQFTYTTERAAEFALLRLSHEQGSVLFPLASGTNTATTIHISAGREVSLDLTLEIDNRAGKERLFGLFCEAALELEPVRAELQRDDDLPPLPGCRVDSVTLQKKLR
jgi:hypothetical protein